MRESKIEAHLVQRIKEAGGMALKFVSPARRNVPDRLVLLPGGSVAFVEVKARGEKPTANQLREHVRLRDLGIAVHIVDRIDQVDPLIIQLGGAK